jgi:uncharacterized protein YndB with AHSA1/START domain
MTMDATLQSRDGDWVLTLTRDLPHPAERVWPWLTAPDRLRQWSPIIPDRAFDAVGPREVRENAADDPVSGEVLAVDAPHELVHRWGDDLVRWRLTPTATGCRLTLEHTMGDRGPAAMNAAGWHICFDQLDEALRSGAAQRMVGEDATAHGWEALRNRYAELFGG